MYCFVELKTKCQEVSVSIGIRSENSKKFTEQILQNKFWEKTDVPSVCQKVQSAHRFGLLSKSLGIGKHLLI